jgi:dipeptidyl aminopeptidase/acylaminoacyl peptidase
MNENKNLLKRLFELTLITTLAFGLFEVLQNARGSELLNGNRTKSARPAPKNQSYPEPGISSYPEPVTQAYPIPGYIDPTLEITAKRPPACKFNSPVPGNQVENYSLEFDDPQIVLTEKSTIEIIQWLPESDKVLIILDTSPQVHQLIETFDVKTKQTQLFAERDGAYGFPVWLEPLQAVAYSTSVDDHEELWISYGNHQDHEQLSNRVYGGSLATNKDLLFFLSPSAGGQPQVWNSELKSTTAVPFDLRDWLYSKYVKPYFSGIVGVGNFLAAYKPDGSLIALNANPWLFLVDTHTQQICEVELGESAELPLWAFIIRWSRDGRFLAMLTTNTEPGALFHFSDLTLLDTATGELKTIKELAPGVIPGQHYVTDFAWSPDSRYIAAVAVTGTKDGVEEKGLFLVNPYSGEAQPIPSSRVPIGGSWTQEIAWSRDGSQLAVVCQNSGETSLCIFLISKK